MRTLRERMNNKKGFTLAELLIVVAIIAIMIAISVPIFTSQLNKAKEATDQANERAAKSAAVSAFLTESPTPSAKTYYDYDAEKGVAEKLATAPDPDEPKSTLVSAYGKKATGIVRVIIEPSDASGNPNVSFAWVPGK